ncbi:hypothetical protein [Cytobacillus solani]|uniref:hypothetical protein n=1 Tax=Cytobacillus solani TaxID=1637975 RepID=UPI0006F47CB2|nr:hypothetical protein [Cytobacillus solani]
MKFIEQHPDYELYNTDGYYIKEIPRELIEPLKGLLIGQAESASDLKRFCAIIAKYIPTSPSTNWGWDWVIGDLDDLIWQLFNKKRFSKFMDCLAELASETGELDDINDILGDVNIGYFLERVPYEGLIWQLKNPIDHYAESINDSLEELPSIFESTREHLEQAKLQLARSDKSSRARKDALRDCISALEALLRQISGENDFRASVQRLISDDWGPKAVLRDATSIWTHIHEQKPDVRHGNPELIDLPIEETIYWIDRINSLVKYIYMKAE